MAGSSCTAVIVLMCGLPAAGKTTLAKHFTSSGNTPTRLYERISFDDLYEQAVNYAAESKTSEFNPDIWQTCQQEMVVRVTKRIEQQSAFITSNPMQQLVLLVDDNFQYQSLRKRFFHLAADCSQGKTTASVAPRGILIAVLIALDSFSPDDRALFALSKEHWNSSFVVYPTVAKHAAPVEYGMERGGILLETNDFTFHFEMSSNEQHLLFIQEYHYASLRENSNEELQQVVDDSQWPGYITKVPIYIETNTAYYIPTDLFLANGFFVSSKLSSRDFSPIKTQSESFTRNTMLYVEYELDSGMVGVNFAIGLLPEQVMPQRVADDRIGYFSKRYTEYGMRGQDLGDDNGFHWWDPQTTVIHRRKLELDPTTNTVKDPITYYIDPSVPKEWREAFAAGVNAWAPAFERIGFTNAIRAVLPGDNDWPADYRLGDLRYNSISVMISERTYAQGPTITDPRSGEILHSDITFEYGFFNEVIADFDLKSPVGPPQAGTDASSNAKHAFDRTGRNQQCGFAQDSQHQVDRMLLSTVAMDTDGYVPKRLIAQHFSDIIMHEVGHTLGLRHNFAGSSAYSRDQLRNSSFVEKHGISTSVMDYLPVNIFSDLTEAEAEAHTFYMTTIGAYDYSAIAYGYSIVDGETPGYKHPRLTELASTSPMFLTDENVEHLLNPYGQTFDLSSDIVDYAADRLEFVKRTRQSSALLNKIPDDASWTTFWQRESVLLRMIAQAIKKVDPVLGGVNVTHAHRSKGEEMYRAAVVPRAMQLQALGVLVRIIRNEDGLFPKSEVYMSYIEVVGFMGEDCKEPSLDYGCLGRGLVDVNAAIMAVIKKAIHTVLYSALGRVVQQDAASPLGVREILEAVGNATAIHEESLNQQVSTFLHEQLHDMISDSTVDSRIKTAIQEIWGFTPPPPVVIAGIKQPGKK
ncbi:hypothetical protein JM18_000822 [Phytophthora kernoviae]|uniref:EcxA zinc-binding domain-containing protein n=2 Tax=Phytophthora kernoviae TaxID=325452 RepID=A0A8T0M8B2_9STRA|nr:hypothetical protein G195_002413 [Phytophthora kernoviae 00238/432]KAG2531698.1 hypothetical protein JM16_000740 [Phytophthora kernoviae]KAG2533017.1 hypothetical protein JM18_000822 [Phytophthora kernoviae]